jgi:hypothetical protein
MRLFLQLILVVASYARQHSYTGTGNMRSNPERGFRHELHGACTGEGTSGLSDDAIKELATYNLTVAQVYCYLPTTPTLDNQTLLSIETAMGRLRQAGVKALWRFAYDHLNPGEQNYTADLIVSHMAQLHSIFNQGMDVVYVLQAGWIGAWGEWHGSKAGLEHNKTATSMVVSHSLFKLLPPDKKMMIRYGMDKAQKVLESAPESDHDPLAFDIVTTETARHNVAYARIGFDNDAVMTDPNDCGTYVGGVGAFPPTTDATCFFNDCDTRTARTFGPPGKAWSRHDLHGPPLDTSLGTPVYDSLHGPMVDPNYAYIQRESPFVPMDCEMDWNTGAARTGCNSDANWPFKVPAETFAWRARDMHYSTMSLVHGYWVLDGKRHPEWAHNETIDSWMKAPLNLTRLYLDKLPVSKYYAAASILDKLTGFDYIRDHLGYRLELQHATWTDELQLGPAGSTASLPFSATLLNWGFAAPINPRPVQLVILSADRTRIVWRSASLVDPTTWQPHIPGSPFYTPSRHTFGGNLAVNVTAAMHLAMCEPPASDCMLPIGLHMPDVRNELFAASGVADAFSIRLANENMPWVTVEKEGGVNVLGELHVHYIAPAP